MTLNILRTDNEPRILDLDLCLPDIRHLIRSRLDDVRAFGDIYREQNRFWLNRQQAVFLSIMCGRDDVRDRVLRSFEAYEAHDAPTPSQDTIFLDHLKVIIALEEAKADPRPVTVEEYCARKRSVWTTRFRQNLGLRATTIARQEGIEPRRVRGGLNAYPPPILDRALRSLQAVH